MTSPTPVAADLEASLAPREGDILSLPFDQYGRMRIVQNILTTLYSEIARERPETAEGEVKLRVLDVGGYPGNLRGFLNADFYELAVLDVVPDDGSIAGYVHGSGLELPFEDGTLDVVTALDTLEHIPAPDRDRFLAEMMRVARHAVVLINPIQSTETDLAEETLNEYIRWILDAQQEQLAEHRAYGLPSFQATRATLETAGWLTLPFTVANVYNWLMMMIAKHYLIAMRTPEASAFERTLDRFYNLTFSDGDRADPPYRGVIVAVRPELEPALKAVQQSYPPVPTSDIANSERLQLTQLLMRLFDLKLANHEDRLLREQMARRDKQIAQLEQRVATQDMVIDQLSAQARELSQTQSTLARVRESYEAEFRAHSEYLSRLESEVKNKDEHIRYLEHLLQAVEGGRVMRITRAVSRFIGRH